MEGLQGKCCGIEELKTFLDSGEEVLRVGVVDAESLLVLALDAMDDCEHALDVLDALTNGSELLLFLRHHFECSAGILVHSLCDIAYGGDLIEHRDESVPQAVDAILVLVPDLLHEKCAEVFQVNPLKLSITGLWTSLLFCQTRSVRLRKLTFRRFRYFTVIHF